MTLNMERRIQMIIFIVLYIYIDYSSTKLSLFADVVQLVSESRDPAVRPRVADDDGDVRYLKMMQSCWDENPLQRTYF